MFLFSTFGPLTDAPNSLFTRSTIIWQSWIYGAVCCVLWSKYHVESMESFRFVPFIPVGTWACCFKARWFYFMTKTARSFSIHSLISWTVFLLFVHRSCKNKEKKLIDISSFKCGKFWDVKTIPKLHSLWSGDSTLRLFRRISTSEPPLETPDPTPRVSAARSSAVAPDHVAAQISRRRQKVLMSGKACTGYHDQERRGLGGVARGSRCFLHSLCCLLQVVNQKKRKDVWVSPLLKADVCFL